MKTITDRLFKILFFTLVVKPIVFLLIGLNLIGREKLPSKGPAIIAANHNSHLDALVLMSLYPFWTLHRIRPVAAADYFLKNRFLAWFSQVCIGIIPLDRSGSKGREDLFSDCLSALDNGDILILFPEGSRGEPEKISRLKKGIYHLAKAREETKIIPVVMHGLGKALPKGEALLVPFNCDVVIGDELPFPDDSDRFLDCLASTFTILFQYCLTYRNRC